MKTNILKFVLLSIVLMASGVIFAQTEVDTTIYTVVEEMPRFPGCEQLDTTIAIKHKCSEQSLLNFIYQNVRYPLEANQNGIEGTVVITFIVEPDSTISDAQIVKDIGGGCGLEAMRVVSQMNDIGVRWVPAKKDGKAVRVKYTLPVRFKLEEAPPYIMVGLDTVYTTLETPLEFTGGNDALRDYLGERVKYPASGNDSCSIGSIDVQILVMPDGKVRILDLTDFNDLGFDFWYEAIDASTSTFGKWIPATYEGRAVPSAYDLSLSFIPTAATCKDKIDRYEVAVNLANEGLDMYNAEEKEAGIAKITEAIEMFPKDAGFLYMRGQAYLDMNEFSAACEDLSQVRRIALVNWFDTILPIICK